MPNITYGVFRSLHPKKCEVKALKSSSQKDPKKAYQDAKALRKKLGMTEYEIRYHCTAVFFKTI